MRALVVHEPNRFSVEEVERPRPGRYELLCRVKAIAAAAVREFLFVALPLAIRGATGSMVDPVAVV